MRVTYDQEADCLRILLSDEDIEESDEEKPGVIIDYEGQGNVVGLEVLDASTRIANPEGAGARHHGVTQGDREVPRTQH